MIYVIKKQFLQVGLIPISRIFQTEIPSKKAKRSPSPDRAIKNWIAKHFDDPYYWDKGKSAERKDKRFFMDIWNKVKNYIKTSRIKVAMVTLYLIQKLYSPMKYCPSEYIRELGNRVGRRLFNKDYKYVD